LFEKLVKLPPDKVKKLYFADAQPVPTLSP